LYLLWQDFVPSYDGFGALATGNGFMRDFVEVPDDEVG